MIDRTDRRIGEHESYVLILTDMAVVAAVSVHDPDFVCRDPEWSDPWKNAQYGRLYDVWLERRTDPDLRQRVTAMASAAATSLTHKDGASLCQIAVRYGLPLDRALAEQIAQHFSDRRDAVLTYRH